MGFILAGGRLFIDFGGAVCRQSPCGPVLSLELWVNWVPLTCMAFKKWVLISLDFLMTSLGRWWWCTEILVCIRGLVSWFREDLASGPYA